MAGEKPLGHAAGVDAIVEQSEECDHAGPGAIPRVEPVAEGGVCALELRVQAGEGVALAVPPRVEGEQASLFGEEDKHHPQQGGDQSAVDALSGVVVGAPRGEEAPVGEPVGALEPVEQLLQRVEHLGLEAGADGVLIRPGLREEVWQPLIAVEGEQPSCVEAHVQGGEQGPTGDGDEVGDAPGGMGRGLAARGIHDTDESVIAEQPDGAVAVAEEAFEALVCGGGPAWVVGGGVERGVGRDDHTEQGGPCGVEVEEGEVGLEGDATVQVEGGVGGEGVAVSQGFVGPGEEGGEVVEGVWELVIDDAVEECVLDVGDGLGRRGAGVGEHAGREEEPRRLEHPKPVLMDTNTRIEGHGSRASGGVEVLDAPAEVLLSGVHDRPKASVPHDATELIEGVDGVWGTEEGVVGQLQVQDAHDVACRGEHPGEGGKRSRGRHEADGEGGERVAKLRGYLIRQRANGWRIDGAVVGALDEIEGLGGRVVSDDVDSLQARRGGGKGDTTTGGVAPGRADTPLFEAGPVGVGEGACGGLLIEVETKPRVGKLEA